MSNLYDHVHCLGIRCTNLYAMYQSLWTSKWSSSDASVNDNPEKTVRSHALHWHAYFLVAKVGAFWGTIIILCIQQNGPAYPLWSLSLCEKSRFLSIDESQSQWVVTLHQTLSYFLSLSLSLTDTYNTHTFLHTLTHLLPLSLSFSQALTQFFYLFSRSY